VLRYRVLGPIEVVGSDGARARPGSRKQRLLLAGLVGAVPRPVTPDRLIDALWPRELPSDPAAALQTRISRLRGFLRGHVPGADVVREAGGYRLSAEPSEVDAGLLEARVAEARIAPTAEAALELLGDALELAEGRPYEELDEAPLVEADRRRLEELLTSARERRVECLLALGRVSEARESAEPLVAADPLREKPRALLMEALYRDGRQAEALECYQRYRRELSEELGLEPSPAIRQLELEILRHDRALRPDGAGPAAPATEAPELRIDFVTDQAGRQVAFAVAGDGPPLLIPPAWVNSLAGLGSGSDPRSTFFARLSRHFRLILYDRLGMGLSASQGDSFTFEGDAEEAWRVLDAAGVDRTSILALSQAGPLAIRMAAERPDRVDRLVLLGTYGSGPRLYPREDIRESMLGLVRASWGIGSKVLADLIIPDATADQARVFARLQRDSTTPERAARMLARHYEIDVTDLLPHLSHPTLVIHYEGDQAVPFKGGRELAALIPGARLVTLDGVAHLPRARDVDRIVAEIVAFEKEGRPT
jgi:DNA-binding SARP family transcriptional activator/pimeloyl-ACP methyl ester carboxylesterase